MYVEEVAAGARPLEGVGTAVAAFVGLAESGPFNRPTLVSNWTQFSNTFGGFVAGIIARIALKGHEVAVLESKLTAVGYGFIEADGRELYFDAEAVECRDEDAELDGQQRRPTLGIERSRPEELHGGDPAANADAIRRVLGGEEGGRRDAILLNASAALVAAGLATELREGLEHARDAVVSGAAAERLEQAAAFSWEDA